MVLRNVGGGKDGSGSVLTTVTVFLFFLFFFSFLFLNHIFIVSTVQEMTCIFNDMAKTKPKINSTINKRNNHNKFLLRDQLLLQSSRS